jgi:hypothetical protein
MATAPGYNNNPKPGTAAGKYGSPAKPKPNITPTPTWKPTNPGWGAATNANDMSGFGYDKPGVAPGAVTVQPQAPAKPSYGDFLASDPWVKQAQAAGESGIQEGESAFQKSLRQAFIDFGASDTSRLGDYAKYIDAPTIEAAKQNKFSKLAQSLKAQTANLRRGRAALAARGILSSGQATNDTLEQQNARETSDYGSLRDFLGGADQGLSSLAGLRRSYAESLGNAQNDAAKRYSDQYPDYSDAPGIQGSAPPTQAAAPKPISWGNNNNITTKAQLIAQLAPGVSYAQWAANHKAAAAGLK